MDFTAREPGELTTGPTPTRGAGDKALSKAFLIGTGTPAPTYLRWAVNYNDDNFQLEYFYQTSLLGVTSMIAGTPQGLAARSCICSN
jgi:hypothetical protein